MTHKSLHKTVHKAYTRRCTRTAFRTKILKSKALSAKQRFLAPNVFLTKL